MEMIIGHSLAPLNSWRTMESGRASSDVTTTRAGKCRMFVQTARLDASHHSLVSREGRGENFFLTSSFIG
jgi:hypothetical protein